MRLNEKCLKRNWLPENRFLDFVYSRTHPDGSLKYLMVSGEPMFDTVGRFTGYRGTGKDVTETLIPNHKGPVNS